MVISVISLVVSTHLKNMSQNGNLPQVVVNIKKYLKPPPPSDFHNRKDCKKNTPKNYNIFFLQDELGDKKQDFIPQRIEPSLEK